MTTIEGSFYKLTPVNEASNRFDLELLYDVGGKNPRQEFKIEGYGYPLEVAMERIIHYAIRKKHPDTITLKEYLNEFIREKEALGITNLSKEI
jgi:hypothetical protein